MHLKTSFNILAVACLLVINPAHAQPRESIEGIHYQALPNSLPTETAEDVIEVRELFWYGCTECFTLEPITTSYRDGVRGDVKMIRAPAVWNDIMATHARLYYTAVAVNTEDRLHQAAFTAIHEDLNPLRSEAQIRALFLENGVSTEDFETAWQSEEVINAVQQARLRTGDYAITKLPSMIINGRYIVSHNEKVHNHVELNIAVNMVIRNLRDERRTDF